MHICLFIYSLISGHSSELLLASQNKQHKTYWLIDKYFVSQFTAKIEQYAIHLSRIALPWWIYIIPIVMSLPHIVVSCGSYSNVLKLLDKVDSKAELRSVDWVL